MPNAIPDKLLIYCRTIFFQCREFASDENLRAFFRTYLSPFQAGLPQASSLEIRVDLCIDHIYIKRFRNGESLFVVLLEKLCNLYDPNDQLHHELHQLHFQINAIFYLDTPPQIKNLNYKNRLLDQILRLDFSSQIKVVRKVIDEHPIAAFIIHGPPNYGQRVLAYRLSHLKPQWESAQYITFDAGANGIGNSSSSLWGEVAKRMNLPYNTDPMVLAKNICQWIQSHDVIFTIHTVDYIPASILSNWLNEFWKPLVSFARQNTYLERVDKYLLLFMVDYRGYVCESGVPFIEQPEQVRESYLPLRLPVASLFPEAELDFWIDAASDVLPTRPSVQTLLASTENGIPDLVYRKICSDCDISWEGELVP